MAATPLDQSRNLLERRAPQGFDWDYDKDKIYGVNLGGWLVLEPYITPSLFDRWSKPGDDSQVPVDEYHYAQKLGRDAATTALEEHWSTWYQEDDFQKMKDAGLNFVRIPIGYWAFKLLDNDPYVQGQIKYLDKAIEWARKYDLKVWVDLHGAPGSQNGFDNSGLRDLLEWQNGDNVDVTLQVLQLIFQKYGEWSYHDVVIGIELVNEPLGPSLSMEKIKDFYTKGYNNLRKLNSVAPVVIHDAFMQQDGYWNDFLTTSNTDWNIVLDHHHYQVFSPDQVAMSIDDHIKTACGWGESAKHDNHWNVAGEWSAALTDCARWLNGVRRGARWSGDYDNSPRIGSCDPYLYVENWSDDFKTNLRKYFEAQLDAFEQTGGWVFWNWKTENAPEWDFKKLIAAGIVPQPLNDRQYPNQCQF